VALVCLYIMLTRALTAEENRIWLDGKINGHPVRLILDTGTFDSFLYPEAARMAGVKVYPPLAATSTKDFSVRLGTTEPFDLTILNRTSRTTFGTYDIGSTGMRVPGHGAYGWKHLKTNTFLIDAEALSIKLLDRVPDEATNWTKLAITAADTLTFEVPGEFWPIAVDTGSPSGVSLRPQQWREWKAANTNGPVTLEFSGMPSGGLSVRQEAWARELLIGNLRLTEIPIRQPTPREVAAGEVVFGLAALARVDFIVDGGAGWVYLRPKRTPPRPYDHSRLGAVFAPRHSQAEEVVAHVVEEAPPTRLVSATATFW